MAKVSILEQLGQKGVDIEPIVNHIIKNPKGILGLIEALKVEKRAVKFKSVFKKEVEKENGRKVRYYVEVFTLSTGEIVKFCRGRPVKPATSMP